jgi:hypothetical protein
VGYFKTSGYFKLAEILPSESRNQAILMLNLVERMLAREAAALVERGQAIC